jgi:hypothetical protein
MDQQSTQPRRDRVVVRERVGEYLLTAFERPEFESPAGESSLTGTFADQINCAGSSTGCATSASSSSASAPVD